ncbi:MAG: type I-E CRISPR-associated protein Cse1/CasA [Micrococcales bacterium]|nr:type I-E CRISPR-associated protein Cse1/CasA [Micrococcales bacterium]
MSNTSFDLTKTPWVQVRLSSGDLTELSLLDIFAQAHELRAIAGELATQDAAVLRLLLAILRRSHPHTQGTEAWGELWRRGRFDMAPLVGYLERYRDRFDLLHPRTPFYQVADLHTAKGELTELTRLVADIPAGHQYFTTRAGPALESMTLAESARWLVHCQAFDPSGIKSGAVGDDRVKGGKGYPIGVAWCGWLGLVIVEGENLFQTLLLNLPIGTGDGDPAVDLPVWERPPQTAAVDGRAFPAGPADLATWQSRRVRIGHDGTHATGVLIANGDPLHPRNRFHDEFMTGWRRSEQQMRNLGTTEDVFMPRTHLPDRAVWRGLDGLLLAGDAAATGRVGRWRNWLAQLRNDGELPEDAPVRMRAVGVQYGSQSSVIDDITDDALPMSVATLSDPVLGALAVDAVADVDAAVRFLGTLAAELAEVSGASGDTPGAARSSARERGYEALDVPYRTWLRGLSSQTERDVERPRWQRQVCDTVIAVARDLVRNAGPVAWVGREVPRGSGTVYLDAALAENNFYHQLRKTFAPAFETQQEGEVE